MNPFKRDEPKTTKKPKKQGDRASPVTMRTEDGSRVDRDAGIIREPCGGGFRIEKIKAEY